VTAGSSLDRDTALVTGVLGNLGPVWADALLGAGARVVGVDLFDVKTSEEFAALLDRYGDTRLRLLRADVTDRASLGEVFRWCESQDWLPSVLVNNAGIDHPPTTPHGTQRIEEIPRGPFTDVFDVNVYGTFLTMQLFGPAMVEAGRGSIINIGSLYAAVAPDQRLYDHLAADPPFLKAPAYGASKAAVVNLTRYFATLWAPFGVRVNALSPGGVRGRQDDEFQRKYASRVPMGRMATPADLGGPLIFLASSASSYVTGIDLRVDGGFTAW
jgi:NAD(P)-dependent dehydrogenase (short-subunit alcohol dehydrogenase family)